MPYNNSNFRLFIGLVESMETLTASRVPSSPCGQCTRLDCPPVDMETESVDQPFDSESTGSSEDLDLVHIHSGEDWVALLDDDLSQPATDSSDTFRITTLQ